MEMWLAKRKCVQVEFQFQGYFFLDFIGTIVSYRLLLTLQMYCCISQRTVKRQDCHVATALHSSVQSKKEDNTHQKMTEK